MARMRADRLLVARGIFSSRASAQAAIEAGLVVADGQAVVKASQLLGEAARVEASPAHPYVSRGGVKLAAALSQFGIDARGKICLDVGASTGGFTEVLLQAGAQLVHAVDVGTAQLHDSLRARPDVVVMEQTDIRRLDPARLSRPPELIVIDVSFISLALVLPAVTALAARPATLIALIKPQFEAGERSAHKGVVRNPAARAAACDAVSDVARDLGWSVRGVIESPIAGGDGNREFLLCAERNAAPA